MLNQVIGDGIILESYGMPDHDDTHHLVTGGQRHVVRYTNTDTTLTKNDYTLTCNALSGNILVTLPSAVTEKYRVYVIKKTDNSGNTVTIDGAGSELVEGGLTITLTTQYSAYTIQSIGNQWDIIGKV